MRADDPFRDRYARGTRSMTASEIRALFAVAARPEVVSLAGGMPFTAALPFDVVGDVLDEVLAEEGPAALQYAGGQGDPRLRDVLAELMRHEGIRGSGGDVVVTEGSQQALDLLARMFCDPGDVIVAEGPSYVGALSAFSQYQVAVCHVPLDDEGVDPDALADTLARLERDGRRVKFLYTVPNFHNPAGVTLAADRRDRVVELARRHNVLILEDNPYGMLGFERHPGGRLPLVRRLPLARDAQGTPGRLPGAARRDPRRARRGLPGRGDLDQASRWLLRLGAAPRSARQPRHAGQGDHRPGRIRPRR